MDNKFLRKQVGQKVYTIKKIVEEPVYWTNDEDFILVKNTVDKIVLDNKKTNEITIKALSQVVISCTENKIDEENEILISNERKKY